MSSLKALKNYNSQLIVALRLMGNWGNEPLRICYLRSPKRKLRTHYLNFHNVWNFKRSSLLAGIIVFYLYVPIWSEDHVPYKSLRKSHLPHLYNSKVQKLLRKWAPKNLLYSLDTVERSMGTLSENMFSDIGMRIL